MSISGSELSAGTLQFLPNYHSIPDSMWQEYLSMWQNNATTNNSKPGHLYKINASCHLHHHNILCWRLCIKWYVCLSSLFLIIYGHHKSILWQETTGKLSKHIVLCRVKTFSHIYTAVNVRRMRHTVKSFNLVGMKFRGLTILDKKVMFVDTWFRGFQIICNIN